MHLKPGCCLTLLSEATRKALVKRSADGKGRALGGRRRAFKEPGYAFLKPLEKLWASAQQMA